MNTRRLLLSALVAVSLVGCGGPRAFTRGTYEDPNTIEMLGDRFNENDLQLIAKKMAESLATS
ncbi:MAG: penicillin-binding protein activator LpoB, partial [Myxococcaceae bacterium]